MGGCRCSFRDCHVSSARQPRMHFFRFPFKDPERYKKWRQFTKMEHMLKFTEVRRKNVAICGRHFRPECFMNYKMDRLAPNALPTLMRLSRNVALDYELDMECGVLITLDNPTLRHLIPPDDFDCPLHLDNDQVLTEKLNQLQRQKYGKLVELEMLEYEVTDYVEEYEESNFKSPTKSSSNTVEILETIQVKAPNSKRSIEIDSKSNVEELENSVDQKKFRCINTYKSKSKNNYVGEGELKSGTAICFDLRSHQKNVDEVGQGIDLKNANDNHNNEEISNKNQLVIAPEAFNFNDDDDDNNIEFFEVRRNVNELQYDLTPSNPDSTIVQLKTNPQMESSDLEIIKTKLLEAQNQISDLKKQNQDYEHLRIKVSLLENENSELKKNLKESEELQKKSISIQVENIRSKKILKENEFLKNKLQKCCEENEKLKEHAAIIPNLKAEVLSKQREAKELKELLEASKEPKLKENDIKELNNKSSLKQTILNLEKDFEQSQKELTTTKVELNQVLLNLNNIQKEKDMLIQQQMELEQSLQSVQNILNLKESEYQSLKLDYDNLHQKYFMLEQKYWKLQALQNQEATVSTSLENTNSQSSSVSTATTPPTISGNSLTKGQLFNGIKRYISAAMVSLLRMEMFGSSEREWRNDERQVSIDLLRLGETVYKYFTDEWRLRLPAIRDVRYWLTQSVQFCDEEDL